MEENVLYQSNTLPKWEGITSENLSTMVDYNKVYISAVLRELEGLNPFGVDLHSMCNSGLHPEFERIKALRAFLI